MFRMALYFVFACVERSVSGRQGLEALERNGREGAVESLKEEMLS